MLSTKSRQLASGFCAWPVRRKTFAAGTQLKNLAPAAIRLARKTAAAAVPEYQPVAPVCPMLARHQLHQIELNFFRVFVFRETKPLRQPDHVGVHHDSFVLMERIAQHLVGGLAPDTWQRI